MYSRFFVLKGSAEDLRGFGHDEHKVKAGCSSPELYWTTGPISLAARDIVALSFTSPHRLADHS